MLWRLICFITPALFASWAVCAAATEEPLRQNQSGAGVLSGGSQTPLVFEPTEAGPASPFDFITRGPGYSALIGSNVVSVDLGGLENVSAKARLQFRLLGSVEERRGVGLDALDSRSNYFIGNDPAEWRIGIPNFSRIRYENVYPGIDADYYSSEGNLEYDFIVSPGADPSLIEIAYAGARDLGITADGDLIFSFDHGKLRQQKPFAYQSVAGQVHRVDSAYSLDERGVLRFQIGEYDRTEPLIIDPVVLAFSTYFGGSHSWDGVKAIAVGADGSTYLAGDTLSVDIPVSSAAFDQTYNGNVDLYIAKLNPAGTALAYSTYLGGQGGDTMFAIAVDRDGNAYVTGRTQQSFDFPITPDAFDSTLGEAGAAYETDAYLVKLDPSGSSLLYSTFLGGSDFDKGHDVAVDAAGQMYVVGATWSADFPTTPMALDRTFNDPGDGERDLFVAKFSADGRVLLYSTYLGGSGDENILSGDNSDFSAAIAVDRLGYAYVSGSTKSADFPTISGAFDPSFNDTSGFSDAFVAKLDPTGSSLVYSTFLGGSSLDEGRGIALDDDGSAYVSGRTNSFNFPTTFGSYRTSHPGGAAAFAAKLSADGSSLTYSTFLGPGQGRDVAVDEFGRASVVGQAGVSTYPTTADAADTTFSNGEAFLSRLSPNGSALEYSTFLGGAAYDEARQAAVDRAGNSYLAGYTGSNDFPVTGGAFQPVINGTGDGFVAKIGDNPLAVNSPPTADAGPDVTASCGVGEEGEVLVTLDGSSSFDPEGRPLAYVWTGPFGTILGPQITVPFTGGSHTITLLVEDAGGETGTDRVLVTVQGGAPPSLNLSLSPNELWPANHRLVTITASIEAVDDCDANPSVELVSIESSEPDSGTSSSDRPDDIQNAVFGSDDRVFDLRAERADPLNTRTYTVTYRVVDSQSNSVTKSAVVSVAR